MKNTYTIRDVKTDEILKSYKNEKSARNFLTKEDNNIKFYIDIKTDVMINNREINNNHKLDYSIYNYPLHETKINLTPLINLENIVTNKDIISYNSTVKNGEGVILFETIKNSKEEIKKHKLIISNSYAKLIPLITIGINAKKLLYPNMSNKNLLKLIINDFDTNDTLISNSFYLKNKGITLPFGVNKNQISFIVKHNKTSLLSNKVLKNLSLETLETVISETKVYLINIKNEEIYQTVKKSKECNIIETELIA